jgi:enamine deaminase RidA (YjgF/YER057c/UK114 family)
MLKILQPKGWTKPRGYVNGIAVRGRMIFVSGQIGWNKNCVFESDDLIAQVHQTLRNVIDVLACDGARPEHITSMTWYLVDKGDYLANLAAIGRAYRDIMVDHYPAMAAVQVAGLIEDRAKVEIQAIAVVPD